MDTIYTKNGDREYEQKLLLPLIHTFQVPEKNKNIVSKLSRAVNFWFKLPEDKLNFIETIVRNTRANSLNFEDIINNTTVRKGMPTATSIYGLPATLNAYYYELFIIMEKIQELGRPEFFNVFVEHVIEMARGQAMEICWRDSGRCPSEQEYIKMAIRKLGHPILLSIRLMQMFGENKFNFTKLAQKLGIFMQIFEDYQSFKMKESDFLGGDSFSEGKFSFPVIYAINNHPENAHLKNLLKQRTKSLETRKYCATLLEKCGSMDYTRQMLAQLMEEIMAEMWKLGENPYMVQILEFISEKLDV